MGLREGRAIAIDESIDRHRFRRVKALFLVLCAHPGDERGQLLSDLCPDDAAVRGIVRRLLALEEPPDADGSGPRGR